MTLKTRIDAVRARVADRLYRSWPWLAYFVAPSPEMIPSGVRITEHKPGSVRPVLIKDFDEFVKTFGRGDFLPATIRFEPASNSDPGCVDVVVVQGGLELRHKNKALDHPSVPQSERDAAEKERREMEDDA